MLRLAHQRALAPKGPPRNAVETGRTTIQHTSRTFGISESSYLHRGRRVEADVAVADWLIRQTTTCLTWGFGLCFLNLRNVKRLLWNHKRVYQVYRALELNVRFNPRQRLVPDTQQTLAVSNAPNAVLSIDFVHGGLADVRNFRLFNVLHDLNRGGLTIGAALSLPAVRLARARTADRTARGSRRPFAVTINRHASIGRCSSKRRPRAFIWTSYSRGERLHRTNRTVRYNWLAQHVFDTIKRSGRRPLDGSGRTAANAPKWLWVASHRQ